MLSFLLIYNKVYKRYGQHLKRLFYSVELNYIFIFLLRFYSSILYHQVGRCMALNGLLLWQLLSFVWAAIYRKVLHGNLHIA